MLNTLKFGAPIRLKNLAAAPAGPENAAAYYNSTNHQVAVYVDGAWDYLALGSEVDTLEGSMGAAITGDGSFNVAAFSTASFIDDATSFTNAFLQLDAAISATDANVTLQDAYDNGAAIITDGADVAISGDAQLVVSATQGIKSNILEMYDAAASVTEYSQRRYYDAIVLTGNTTEVQSEFYCAIATWGGIIINYVITDTSNERRIGRLLVTHDSGTGTTISDDYAETDAIDLTWTAAINGGMEISSTRSDSTNLSMNAEVVRFQV